MNELQDTSKRIITAFIELFRENGFKGTTTRAIAERAGVNEVTVFRHFGSKKGIMEAALNTISFNPKLDIIIKEKMIWELEHDLRKIAEEYHASLEQVKDLIFMGFKEEAMFPEINELIVEIPRQLKASLVSYLSEMSKRGKLIETDIELQAMNFIWLNFGYFTSVYRFGETVIARSRNDFIKHSVQLFTRGLTP